MMRALQYFLKKLTSYVILVIILGTLSFVARAQTINDLIRELGIEELGRDYLRPGADAIGYSFNSGLFHTARIDTGFRIWIGARGVWTFIPNKDKSFVAKLPSSLISLGYPSEIETATIFGDYGAILKSSDPTQPEIKLPDGTNLRQTFLVLPHVTIGSFAASELMFRGIPRITFDPEIGKVSFFGIGLKHSPSQYIRIPFDFSIMGAAQRFEIAKVMTVTNLNANVHASVPLAILTLFGGVGYESYLIDVSYTYIPKVQNLPAGLDKPQTITLDFARRNLRFTVGVNITFIPLLDLTADYSFGIQDNFTIGAGITF